MFNCPEHPVMEKVQRGFTAPEERYNPPGVSRHREDFNMVYLKSPYPSIPAIPDLNVHHALFNAPGQEKVPDYVLYIDGLTGRKRTWFEFRDLVYDGATALAAPVSAGGLGLDGSRDIVGLYSHNCLDYAAIVNSLLAVTVPFSLMSAFSTPRELMHLLRLSKATALFVEPALLPNALAAAKEVRLPESAIHVLEGHVNGRRSFQEMIDDVKKREVQRIPPKPATKSTLGYLVFSSGTSGLPKAVICSHGNIWATILMGITAKVADEKYIGAPPLSGTPASLLFLPFHHAYGLYFAVLRPFVAPASTVMIPQWNIKTVLEIVPRYRINALPVIPSAMHQLVDHPDFRRTDWSSVKMVLTGAAYTPPQLADTFKKAMKMNHIMEGYGASEMVCFTSSFSVP
ncbi:hypothetical protein NM688_g6485 [Phlebia brevispora]|uniref:Uncharacterized protein n=1 Tax=Phlebia brevispora TaxID=194682 RepID=A0ACC1SFE8_9APHY|nr:hypothetical protein NM688_g6485 [Phlebia brevispora]